MNFILRWLRRLSASDTAVRAVEESLLDWKHEVDVAPGVGGAFTSDFRMAAGIGRLIVRVIAHDVADALTKGWWLRLAAWTMALAVGIGAVGAVFFGDPRAGYRGSSLLWALDFVPAAMIFAAFLTIARARRTPPAIGLLVLVGVMKALAFAAFQQLSPYPRHWFPIILWFALPALWTLAGDRVRRETHSRVSAVVSVSIGLGMIFLAGFLWELNGPYREYLPWLTPATPAALWLYFLWKQERSTMDAETEEVHV